MTTDQVRQTKLSHLRFKSVAIKVRVDKLDKILTDPTRVDDVVETLGQIKALASELRIDVDNALKVFKK